MLRGSAVVTAALSFALVIGGCGGSPEPGAPAPGRVRLNVVAPADNAIVRRDAVTLSGRVTPATADVRVLGRDVTVRDGSFETTIALDVGTNVVDVLASAGRRRPAMAAIRITRQVAVRIPELGGVSADEARDRLAGLGLRPKLRQDGGILNDLLPVDSVVCETTPDAGTEVTGGAEVEVVVSKLC